jgi:hypothetical protein
MSDTNHEDPHYAAPSVLLPPAVSLAVSNVLSKTLSLFCTLNMKNQVSNPQKTARRYLTFIFLGSKG